ncbi:hypothetical protein VA596_04365 [Amycolatopsis sp., V23-08]|uniref:Uncharacterized protein n=1 Tax=Amycolatopsis heterodermiae TaxID=3110235 RepID=A0ABU5QZ99_9PSEU|nr:hypothetical protein [Amycolatopsis sp., V23-08]MEA5358759.1 hypothetical protein [Amycolatopsis sp., V23-08]
MLKIGLALLCLPFAVWVLGMILYAVLPPFLFWVVTVLLAIWAGRAIVKVVDVSKM